MSGPLPAAFVFSSSKSDVGCKGHEGLSLRRSRGSFLRHHGLPADAFQGEAAVISWIPNVRSRSFKNCIILENALLKLHLRGK